MGDEDRKGHRMRTTRSDQESSRDQKSTASHDGLLGKRTLTMDLAPDAGASGSATGGSPVVQRRADGAAPTDASVTQTAAQGIGSGSPLPERARMESLFGADFGDVKVHTGNQAAGASRAIGAEAYTMGNDIVVGNGAPTPSLIAHELTHVVQQRAGVGPSGGVGKAG